MRPAGFLLALCVAMTSAPAGAEVAVDLRASDPVAALPVVSANKLNFLRAYRRWRPSCKRPDIFVEDGGIDLSVEEPQYSSTQLVGGCGEAFDAFSGNISAVNASMSSTQCSSAALRGKVTAVLPTSFEAAGMRVDITAASTSAHVTVNRLATATWTGGRRMTLDATPYEVRGWYVVDQKSARQLAVLLATKSRDGTIAERWMEIWAKKPSGKLAPVDVARNWLLAFAARDNAALVKLTGVPFERNGLGSAACAKARAKKPGELGAALDCAVAASATRYVGLYDEQEFFKVEPRALAPELSAHAAALTKLAKGGHTLVQFASKDARGEVTLAFAIKNGKVTAVFEDANAN